MSITRRLHVALLVLLILQAASWPAAMATAPRNGLSSITLAISAYAVALALAAWVAYRGFTRRPPGVAFVAPLLALALIVGGGATRAGEGTGYSHPSLALAIGTAAFLLLDVGWPWRIGVALALAAAYLVGIGDTLGFGSSALTSTGGNLAALVAVPLLAGWIGDWLGAAEEERTALARFEEEIRRADSLRVERAEQHRLLHDTVLSTLSALSRGSLDTSDPAVTHRIAADADYLRGLIATGDSAVGMHLVGELARLSREHAGSGLRVHSHIADVPDELPVTARRAVGDSLREALANVVKHSGTKEAWVTIVGRPEGGLCVTVADRGRGFDPQAPTAGLGIRGSLLARMESIGGTALVDSAPGQGTMIELRWPA